MSLQAIIRALSKSKPLPKSRQSYMCAEVKQSHKERDSQNEVQCWMLGKLIQNIYVLRDQRNNTHI